MDELILKKESFDIEISELINKADLPAFMIRQTLKDILEQVLLLEQRQLNEAKVNQQEEKENKTSEEEKIEEEK